MTAMASVRTVGSVMPAADGGERRPGNLWRLWTEGWAHHATFRTARSALAALLAQRGARRVWLPAYICDAVVQASAGIEIVWYDAGPRLRVETARFSGLKPGDAVLAVDYFGRSPEPAFRAFAASRPDVLWIEDRAQALAPDAPAWGEVLLYSARKLIGAADGALMISAAALPQPDAAHDPDEETALWAPEDARAADLDGTSASAWFALFQRREAAFGVDRAPMSQRSHRALTHVEAQPVIRRRRANYARLLGRLADFALWPQTEPDFAPLAFPVLVEARDAVAALMGARGIFCARHWSHLPCPKDGFADAWALSTRMLSIPCDQRYDQPDMDRVADALRAVARPARPF
jgi:hypothetical protein